MKNTIKYIVLFIFLINLTSCSKDDNSTDNERKMLECNVDDVTNSSGDVCCIKGFAEIIPGETLVYEYVNNIQNPDIQWNIVSGDIAIISGDESSKVTLNFGEFFTVGEIEVSGKNQITCSKSVIITKI